MALVDSTLIPLGNVMPSFSLQAPTGDIHSLETLIDTNGICIIFTCNHCPYALAIWDRLIALYSYAVKQNIAMVAINPNINPSYPQDSPENMTMLISEKQLPFEYLVDYDQSVANAYNAQCTPDIYLLDATKKLYYHGRLDDNWQNESAVSKQDLKDAMTALSLNQKLTTPQVPSMGCSIKWNA